MVFSLDKLMSVQALKDFLLKLIHVFRQRIMDLQHDSTYLYSDQLSEKLDETILRGYKHRSETRIGS